MNVCVLGLGKVGLPTACYLSSLGHRVRGYDVDAGLTSDLLNGRSRLPYEPGIDLTMIRVVETLDDGLCAADVVYVIVPTPQERLTLSSRWVESAVAGVHGTGPLIVVGSTLMPPDAARICNQQDVIYNPPLIRLGHVVSDLHFARVALVGTHDLGVLDLLGRLWRWSRTTVVRGDPGSIAFSKLAINVSLSLRVAWANEVEEMCRRWGADTEVVLRAVREDPRLGSGYMVPGFPPGGPCLPRDLDAWLCLGGGSLASTVGVSHLRNEVRRVTGVLDGIEAAAGSVRPIVAVLGATYNPNALDVTGSPGLAVANGALQRGWTVCVYDPAASWLRDGWAGLVPVATSMTEAVEPAQDVVVATAWTEFEGVDFGRRRVWDLRGR